MKNKEYYQKTFSRLTASEDVIQEVMNMEKKKVYRFTKRTAGIAVAAALTLTATGAAYAATDGNFAQLLERITVYINGEEAGMGDYEIFEDENGNSQFVVSLDSDEEITTSVTVKPDAALDPDTHYSIDFNTDRMLAQAEEVPFTLEDIDGRLYLVEKDGSRLDITEAAATDKGYRYAWTDEDGKEHQAFALGTPEEHFIAFSANSVEIDADGTVSGSTNAAMEGK